MCSFSHCVAESHINEMASMGIGNKPCMDIQPSCDNIQNRSLDIPFSSRGGHYLLIWLAFCLVLLKAAVVNG